MTDNTLLGRCLMAYCDACGVNAPPIARRNGVRAVIEHLAAELTLMGHYDAAGDLLDELQPHIIPLRGPEDAA